MTENQALLLDAVVGTILTWAAFVAAGVLGVNDTVQGVIGMVGLCITCLMVGAIDVHYSRKAIERGEDPDDF
jgi:hypothetical protein